MLPILIAALNRQMVEHGMVITACLSETATTGGMMAERMLSINLERLLGGSQSCMP